MMRSRFEEPDADCWGEVVLVQAFDVADAVAKLRPLIRRCPATSAILVFLSVTRGPASARERTHLRRWLHRCSKAGVRVVAGDDETQESIRPTWAVKTRHNPEPVPHFAGAGEGKNPTEERTMQTTDTKQTDTNEKKLDSKARAAAKRAGYVLKKARGMQHADNMGGYMVIHEATNIVEAGARFDMFAEDVLAFFAEGDA